MDLRRVSQTHFCSWIWDFLKEKLYYSNGFLNWIIFPLPFPGWSSDIHLPWNTTSCDDSSSFLCFSVWKSLAVVEILLSEMTSWLIPIQWFHLLQPCWQLRICRQNPLPSWAVLTALWNISRYFLPQGKQRALQGLVDWCFDHIATSVDETVFLSVDLWGELNSCRKGKYGTIYFKIKSLAILHCQRIQCQALSALQLLSCSVLG